MSVLPDLNLYIDEYIVLSWGQSHWRHDYRL